MENGKWLEINGQKRKKEIRKNKKINSKTFFSFAPSFFFLSFSFFFYQIVSVEPQNILSFFFTLYKLLNKSNRDKGQLVLYLSMG